jgi:hypothetical protein
MDEPGLSLFEQIRLLADEGERIGTHVAALEQADRAPEHGLPDASAHLASGCVS